MNPLHPEPEEEPLRASNLGHKSMFVTRASDSAATVMGVMNPSWTEEGRRDEQGVLDALINARDGDNQSSFIFKRSDHDFMVVRAVNLGPKISESCWLLNVGSGRAARVIGMSLDATEYAPSITQASVKVLHGVERGVLVTSHEIANLADSGDRQVDVMEGIRGFFAKTKAGPPKVNAAIDAVLKVHGKEVGRELLSVLRFFLLGSLVVNEDPLKPVPEEHEAEAKAWLLENMIHH